MIFSFFFFFCFKTDKLILKYKHVKYRFTPPVKMLKCPNFSSYLMQFKLFPQTAPPQKKSELYKKAFLRER